MPVIQLPRDTRWGELGAGIGTGLNALVEGYMTKQANEGVAQIMSDPSIADTDKQSRAYKQFGERGSDIYKQFVTTQVLGATLAQKKAETEKERAQTLALTGKDDIVRMLMGLPKTGATTGAATTPEAAATLGVLGGTAPTVPPPTASSNSTVTNSIGEKYSYDPQKGWSDPNKPWDATTSTTTPSPTVKALSSSSGTTASTPVGALSGESPIALMIDQRAKSGGVTFTPEEKRSLILQTAAHLQTTSGLSEIMGPTDKAIEQKQKGMKFPSELSTAQAGATTAKAGAEAAPAVATAAAQRAPLTVPKEQAELTTAQAGAAVAAPLKQAELTSAQSAAEASRPVDVPTELVSRSFPTFSPEQSQAVALAGKTGGNKAVNAEVSKIVEANAKGAGLSESTSKFVRDLASYGAITERFANEMVVAPERLGLLSGSGLKARAEGYGLPIGDPQLLALLNSQKLAAATAARENGNWGVSGTNLTLSKDTSANIDKTAMSNVMMFAGTADQKIKEAAVERAIYEGNPRAQAAIDQAIQPWKNIQAITNTLSATTVQDTPKSKERDVVYFMGNQVDPNTMRALVRQDNTEYKVKPQGVDKRTTYTGLDLWGMATAVGTDPAEMLRRMGGKP